MQIGKYLWSDNWWLENNRAYICAGEIAALFCVNMDTLQCEFLARIPDCKFKKYRLNSFCRKDKNKIFCFPYEEKDICSYDLEKETWEKIEIGFESRLMICMNNWDIENNRIWLMEHRRKKIFQVNAEKKIVEKEYIIPSDKNAFSGYYVLVQNNLYCTAGNEIHCIDTRNDTITTFEMSNIKAELYTICYDGHNFWLSGDYEVIYVWNPQEGVVRTITNFIGKSTLSCSESSMLIKNAPLFQTSVSMGKYIWCIPLQCNIPIIYIDKENYKIGVLEIENEQETEESLISRGATFKYILEYIRQDRYIGLYSCKNQTFFEIDTVDLCAKSRECWFSNETFLNMAREICADKDVLNEGERDEQDVFSVLLYNTEERKRTFLNVGKQIYSSVKVCRGY